MKLALFHTIFNVSGVLIVYPFMGNMVAYLETLFREDKKDRGKAKYLTNEVMQIPATALVALRKKTIHLYDKLLKIIAKLENKKFRLEVEIMEESKTDDTSIRYHDLSKELIVLSELIKKANKEGFIR